MPCLAATPAKPSAPDRSRKSQTTELPGRSPSRNFAGIAHPCPAGASKAIAPRPRLQEPLLYPARERGLRKQTNAAETSRRENQKDKLRKHPGYPEGNGTQPSRTPAET